MALHFDLQSLARQFFQFSRWLGASPIGNGHINDTYRIDFEENGHPTAYVLQRLNHEVFRQPEAVMENIYRVTGYLAAQSAYPLAALAPVPAQSGQTFHLDPAGNYWRVFPLLENTFAPETIASPAEAREAACAYGAFARALRDFPAHTLAETIPGFHDTDRRWQVFEEILNKFITKYWVNQPPSKIERKFRSNGKSKESISGFF
jgi:Ser/Thr protein kinase RdoA (MazF antagonist)